MLKKPSINLNEKSPEEIALVANLLTQIKTNKVHPSLAPYIKSAETIVSNLVGLLVVNDLLKLAANDLEKGNLVFKIASKLAPIHTLAGKYINDCYKVLTEKSRESYNLANLSIQFGEMLEEYANQNWIKIISQNQS